MKISHSPVSLLNILLTSLLSFPFYSLAYDFGPYAYFEFIWPPPRGGANNHNISTIDNYPCGGFTTTSPTRTAFPLPGPNPVPVQLRLSNWSLPVHSTTAAYPTAPYTDNRKDRLIYLNLNLNLGSDAGVGDFYGAGKDEESKFRFDIGLRYMQEDFDGSGLVCLEDIWKDAAPGHTLGAGKGITEGMNGTLNIDFTDASGDVVAGGKMCADITFTNTPLTSTEYTAKCKNDSIIVPEGKSPEYISTPSSTSSTPPTSKSILNTLPTRNTISTTTPSTIPPIYAPPPLLTERFLSAGQIAAITTGALSAAGLIVVLVLLCLRSGRKGKRRIGSPLLPNDIMPPTEALPSYAEVVEEKEGKEEKEERKEERKEKGESKEGKEEKEEKKDRK